MSAKYPWEGMPHTRELRFLSAESHKDFSDCFRRIGRKESFPIKGGIIEHGVKIQLNHGELLWAVSYKGDIERWREEVSFLCNNERRILAQISDESIVLSNGMKISLKETVVSEY